jgi:prepilin peptidase CpaA
MAIDQRMLLPALLLLGLLVHAVWTDIQSRRISNGLVLLGLMAGFALQGLVTPGAGLFAHPFGGLGLLSAAGGMLTGFGLLLPMYALGAMGAGDVKLMAMIGAFLGPQDAVGAMLVSAVVGGVLALAVAIHQRHLGRVLANVRQLLLNGVLHAATASGFANETAQPTGKLPYAIAIATGTTAYLVLTRLTGWSLWQ